ncbi:hypothetical protein KFE98_16110 [bacterium SCSIO 12741]|nr:hypothetical protein KFE98_16110 [bacterium SCSIO 12741]
MNWFKWSLLMVLGVVLAIAVYLNRHLLTCESNVPFWKSQVFSDFEKWQKVEKEIQLNRATLDSLDSRKSGLFLRTDDPSKLKSEHDLSLPALTQWFNSNDWGYVAMEGDTIEVSFRSCVSGYNTYDAYFYHNPQGFRPAFTHDLKTGVEILDSLDLGNNWYFLVVKCEGCLS